MVQTLSSITAKPTKATSKAVQVINADQLVQGLFTIGGQGVKFVSCRSRTIPELIGGHPFRYKNGQVNIEKITIFNPMLMANYNAAVLRRLEKEGKKADEFSPGQSWHWPVLTDKHKMTPVCIKKSVAAEVVGWKEIVKTNKGTPSGVLSTPNPFTYIDLVRMTILPDFYLWIIHLSVETFYVKRRTNKIIDKKIVNPYLGLNLSANQGLSRENIVYYRCYSLKNIEEIKVADRDTNKTYHFIVRN